MTLPQRIGKYEVLDTIGRGGFATVYKARDPLMRRVVAIKVFSDQDVDLRRRFLREAQIAGSLDHPNVIRVFDCGFDTPGVYLVEEYLGGEDLKEKIRSRAPISYPDRIAILLQVAAALEFAHSKGVLHRDIKPGNIRVLEDGRVKLMDFGIAKLSGSETPLTKAGTLLGTAGYIAPEQVLGQPVDRRADIFAFGALAYELITYALPFTGKTVTERLRSVLEATPEPITSFWKQCPPELERAIGRCLEKDLERRYPSLAEVIADLSRIETALRAEQENPTTTFSLDELDATVVVGPDETLIARAEPDTPPPSAAATPAGAAASSAPPPVEVATRPSVAAPTPSATPPSPPPPASVATQPGTAPPPSSPRPVAAPPSLSPPRPTAHATPAPPAAPPAVAAGAPTQPVGLETVLAPAPPAPVVAAQGPPAAPPGAAAPAEPRAPASRTTRLLLAVVGGLVLIALLGVAAMTLGNRGDRAADDDAVRSTEGETAAVAPPPVVAAEPAGAASGRVVVDAQPWGELLEVRGSDGRALSLAPQSVTPLVLELPPGDYEVRVGRPAAGESGSCRVTVTASAVERCRVELGAVAADEYFKEAGWWR